jgi:hypothetical protein
METMPTYAKQFIEWQSRDDKDKSIIGLSLLYSQLHHVDLAKSSKVIQDELSQLFGAKAVNEKFH